MTWTERGGATPGRPGVLSGVTLFLTGLVLLTATRLPYMGDQALFRLGGSALAGGQVLYVDFWDLKQPGVFWFFAVADGVGIEPTLLESAWGLALAALAIVVVRLSSSNWWAPPLAALTTVAWPYAVARPAVPSQVELLVGLPMLAALAAAHASLLSDSRRRRDGAAAVLGLSVFTVAMFKIMLLPTLVAVLVVMVWALPRPTRVHLARSTLVACVTLGAFTVLALAALAMQGALTEALRTWFIVPLGAGSRAGRSLERLFETAVKFLAYFAPLVVLAALGAWRSWRTRDPLGLPLVIWALLGGITVAAQLGWYYLMSFIVVPIGLLAVAGLEELVDVVTRRQPRRVWLVSALLLACVLAGPAVAEFGGRMQDLVRARGALTAADLDEFRRRDAQWVDRSAQAEAVRAATTRDDTVVLWGDPMILELADRTSVIAVHGWSPEHLDQTLWRRAADEMRSAMPDLVLVDDFSATMISERGVAVAEVLDENYEVWREAFDLTWYVHDS